MSKQRVIKDEMWDDEWFYELDPSEKLVWVFLLTNPRNNIAGVYQLSRRWAANATGFDRDVFDSIITRFVRDSRLKTHEEWVVIVNFHKHQSKNPKVEAGVVRILENTPKNIVELIGYHSLCIAYPTLLNSTLLNLSDSVEKPTGDSKKKDKTMSFKKYADDFEEGVVDIDTGVLSDPVEEKKAQKKEMNKKFTLAVDWLVQHQGREKKRTSYPKQLKAVQKLYTMGVGAPEAKQVILEAEASDYWKDRKEKPDYWTAVTTIQNRG